MSIWWITLLLLLLALLLVGRLAVGPILRRRRLYHTIEGCEPFLIEVPPKSFDKTLDIPSRVYNYRMYQVNLHRLTCTCRRYREFRAHYPPGSIQRLCRHLRKELERTNLLGGYDDIQRRIILDRARDRCYRRLWAGPIEFAVGYNPRSEYARVFTRSRAEGDAVEGPFSGPCEKYVLQLAKDNWMHGNAPPGEMNIRQTLLPFLKKSTEPLP
ncbi:MAG: hypothetical protein H7831_13490 [Magnetococcus sp. WYHC-3]